MTTITSRIPFYAAEGFERLQLKDVPRWALLLLCPYIAAGFLPCIALYPACMWSHTVCDGLLGSCYVYTGVILSGKVFGGCLTDRHSAVTCLQPAAHSDQVAMRTPLHGPQRKPIELRTP